MKPKIRNILSVKYENSMKTQILLILYTDVHRVECEKYEERILYVVLNSKYLADYYYKY